MTHAQNPIGQPGDFRSTLPAQVLTMAALLQQLAQGMDYLLKHLGHRVNGNDADTWRDQVDQALALFAAPAPLRVVVDISGGGIHAVSCRQPVEIVFVSHERDDLDEGQAVYGFVNEDGHAVALWQMASDASEQDGATVRHYFDQWAKAGSAPR